jgi:hypothetical protein
VARAPEEPFQMKRPEILYKYRALSPDSAFNNTRQTLSRSEVYFASPDQFNDPFECQVEVWVGEDTAPLDRRNDPELLVRLREAMRAKLRVFSMSAINNNQLMWSHYADSHHGICLGFSTETEGEWFGLAEPVHYTDTLPIVDLGADGNPEENFKSIAFCKDSRWSYEHEWRIATMEPERVRQFPPHFLVEVILGCDISKRHRLAVIAQLLARPTPVRLYEAHRNPFSYSTDFESRGVLDITAIGD